MELSWLWCIQFENHTHYCPRRTWKNLRMLLLHLALPLHQLRQVLIWIIGWFQHAERHCFTTISFSNELDMILDVFNFIADIKRRIMRSMLQLTWMVPGCCFKLFQSFCCGKLLPWIRRAIFVHQRYLVIFFSCHGHAGEIVFLEVVMLGQFLPCICIHDWVTFRSAGRNILLRLFHSRSACVEDIPFLMFVGRVRCTNYGRRIQARLD